MVKHMVVSAMIISSLGLVSILICLRHQDYVLIYNFIEIGLKRVAQSSEPYTSKIVGSMLVTNDDYV